MTESPEGAAVTSAPSAGPTPSSISTPQLAPAVDLHASGLHPVPEAEHAQHHHRAFWMWVMCLTGVDYFSTLGYQPSIAFNSAGVLAPIATIVLVLVTLFGALPVYCHVAASSPHGQGSVAMLERLVRGWSGKTLVLALLGFAATDFVITMTLSAADAAAHLLHNPLWNRMPAFVLDWTEDRQRMGMTVILLVLLGAMFLRGFKEVIGMAVVIVGVYLALNLFVLGSGVVYLIAHPAQFDVWYQNLVTGNWYLESGSPSDFGWGSITLLSLLYFPKLALGLSGFETGVAVMPLIEGRPDDDPRRPAGRIRNTRLLLLTAAVIMSVALLTSAFVTATLIPPDDLKIANALRPAGPAADRALAFLAHGEGPHVINPMFGEWFGTLYDISTVVILAFAGMSAMAGLLNLVPQYLPRYGMAPEWARAMRPLALMFTAINLLITWLFNADVDAQGGAYATGVLVLMSSAGVATVIDVWRARDGNWAHRLPWGYVAITAVFLYTTGVNMIERPDGLKIASWFILAILGSSFISRIQRTNELRFKSFEFRDMSSHFLWDSLKIMDFPVLVPHRPGRRCLKEKEANIRERHRLSPEVPIIFVEAELGDPSEFQHSPIMQITEEEGRFIMRVERCASIAHVLATVALEMSRFGAPPEIHFGWSDENPLSAAIGFFLFGEGNVPWRVRELIRKAEPNAERHPQVFIG